jgi:hypothetical protein
LPGGTFVKSAANHSPPRNGSHGALSFVEAAVKAKLAGRIETQPRGHLATLPAFRIIDVAIMAARSNDVHAFVTARATAYVHNAVCTQIPRSGEPIRRNSVWLDHGADCHADCGTDCC